MRCLRGEFAMLSGPVFERVRLGEFGHDWQCLEIDSRHNCISERPTQTAKFLAGCGDDFLVRNSRALTN